MDRPEYQPFADIDVETVRPGPQGFTLTGVGRDQAQYTIDLRFGMPLDSRTRTVLGELLSQCEVTLARRAAIPPRTALRRRRDRADHP